MVQYNLQLQVESCSIRGYLVLEYPGTAVYTGVDSE
jgi:hypothetical protein